jgi:putative lipoprotein (rSAM/lipoprotein system)
MKIIRNRFLTSYNVILTALMAMLGFANSCERFGGTEYGVPHASFIVKGKIVSSEGNIPVPNIKVRMQIDSVSMQHDSAYSDSKGIYQVVDKFGFPISHSYSITFIDTDGTANGEFQTLDTIVEFKDPVYTGGDGNWDSGETQKEFNVVLKPKK